MGFSEFFQDDQNVLGLAQLIGSLNPDKHKARLLTGIAGNQLNFARQQAQQQAKKDEDEARSQSLMELLFRSQGQPPEAIGPPQMTPGPMSEFIPPEMDAGTQPMPQMDFMSQLAGIPGFEGIAAQSALQQMTAPQDPLKGQTSAVKNAMALGLQPGTQQFNDFVREQVLKPATQVNVNQAGALPFKLEPGFMLKDPGDPNKGQTPIPGGSRDRSSTENAAKSQMLRTAKKQIPVIEKMIFDKDGSPNLTNIGLATATRGGVPKTKGRKLAAAYEVGIQAITRLETGAAMPPEEVENTRRRFMPSILDDSPAIQLKWEMYQEFIGGTLKLLDPSGRFDEARFQSEFVERLTKKEQALSSEEQIELNMLRQKHGMVR